MLRHVPQNLLGAFRVNKDVAVILGKHRERARTLWSDKHPRPPGGADGEASAAEREAAEQLKQLHAKADRLRSKKDILTRLNEAQAAQRWAAQLRSQLPSAEGQGGTATAGPRLRAQWRGAAEPSQRTVDGARREVQRVDKQLRAPLPAREAAPRDGARAARSRGEAEARSRARAAAAAVGALMPAAGTFDEMSDAEYDGVARSWRALRDAGADVGPPPLNPEQRDGGRDFLQHAQLRAELLGRGASASEIATAVEAAGIAPITAVLGPGGTGKSAMVHALEREMVASACGHLVTTAYTGVAAAPFGGPTLLSLLNLSIESKSAKKVRQLSPTELERARKKFHEESGVKVEDLGGLIIDEVSFIEMVLLGHVEAMLEQLTDNLHILCGGVPLLICGDNHQKAPPGGAPWYKEMVANALESGRLAASGASLAKGRGLTVLQAARCVPLVRLMRAEGDEDFIAVQRRMRRTDLEEPVDRTFLGGLRWTSPADLAADEAWRFAPVGVLSHVERDTINHAQLERFARAFGLPLVKWRLEMVDEIDDQALRDEVYAEEPNLWGYFVEGAPVNLTETIKSVRKLVNGSPGVLDSLEFRGGLVPENLSAAFAEGRFQVVELAEPPLAANVRVGGAQSPSHTPGSAPGSVLWHGVELEDLSSLIPSEYTPGAQVVPIKLSSNVDTAELSGVVAAQAGWPHEVRVKIHKYMFAFALTDFKLQVER